MKKHYDFRGSVANPYASRMDNLTLTGWRMRAILAWLFAALVFMAVVAFEIGAWIVMAAFLTLGLVYELGVRLVRLVRPEKPLDDAQVKRYVKRRGG